MRQFFCSQPPEKGHREPRRKLWLAGKAILHEFFYLLVTRTAYLLLETSLLAGKAILHCEFADLLVTRNG